MSLQKQLQIIVIQNRCWVFVTSKYVPCSFQVKKKQKHQVGKMTTNFIKLRLKVRFSCIMERNVSNTSNSIQSLYVYLPLTQNEDENKIKWRAWYQDNWRKNLIGWEFEEKDYSMNNLHNLICNTKDHIFYALSPDLSIEQSEIEMRLDKKKSNVTPALQPIHLYIDWNLWVWVWALWNQELFQKK